MAGSFFWRQLAVAKRARAWFAWHPALFGSVRLVSSEAAVTFDSMPGDVLRQVIAACSDDISPGQEVHHDGATSCVETLGVPRFEAVKGLACLSKGMRQQLYTLLPHVDGEARPVHGPWEVVQNAYTEDVYRVLPCTSRRRRATSPSEDEAEFKKQCKMHDALRRF